MAAIRLELDPLSPSDPSVVAIVQSRVDAVVVLARSMAPVRTGELRSSIRGRVTVGAGRAVGVVAAAAPHAMWVHEGTGVFGPGGRAIRPLRAERLSWVGADGRRIFARQVRGVRPRPFLTDALAASGLRGVVRR